MCPGERLKKRREQRRRGRSHYESVRSAPTWVELKDVMVGSTQGKRVVSSVRIQARGHDVGAGDEEAVRVVDLLDRRGRRLAQLDVWRTDAGGWRSGDWLQCVD